MDKLDEFFDYTKITMTDESKGIVDNDANIYYKLRKGVFTVDAMPGNYELNYATFEFDIETAKKLRDFLNTAIVLAEQRMMEE